MPYPMKKGAKIVRLGTLTFTLFLEELTAGPATAQALVEHTGMNLLTVQRLLRMLYERGLIHVAAWERDSQGHRSIRVYGLGPGRDAKKAPIDRAAQSRARRARKKVEATGAVHYTQLIASNDAGRKAA